MLSNHPGWVRTEMGALSDMVDPEIGLEPSMRGVVGVIERHRTSGENLYRDGEDWPLGW